MNCPREIRRQIEDVVESNVFKSRFHCTSKCGAALSMRYCSTEKPDKARLRRHFLHKNTQGAIMAQWQPFPEPGCSVNMAATCTCNFSDQVMHQSNCHFLCLSTQLEFCELCNTDALIELVAEHCKLALSCCPASACTFARPRLLWTIQLSSDCLLWLCSSLLAREILQVNCRS